MTRNEIDFMGTDRDRFIGAWSARAMFVLEFAYVVVFVAGFASLGNTSDPLPDPYLAIAEILILVMAPIMVMLMLAIHNCAPARAKSFTLVALGWMFAAAATTTTVHFVELTVARHINPATLPGYARIFDFEWPSLLYAVDIVAWDVFFGLSLLFAVPAFARKSDTCARRLHRKRFALPRRPHRTRRECSCVARHRDLWLHDSLRPRLPPPEPSVRPTQRHAITSFCASRRRRGSRSDLRPGRRHRCGDRRRLGGSVSRRRGRCLVRRVPLAVRRRAREGRWRCWRRPQL
jgi:hypothetical protein